MTSSQIRKHPLTLQHVVTQRGGFELRIESLELKAGQIACVVGPNGGGKTTLLMTVLGLLPHDGECRVQGVVYDGTQPFLKAQIGFIPDDPELLFESLTAREQWAMTASVLSRFRPRSTRRSWAVQAAELAASIGFDAPATVAGTYSHGMRKKTQIVSALLGDPPVLVIDELRNGLDPLAIKQTEQLIERQRGRGTAILAATHDLWWAQRFADYVYVLHQGRLVAAGTLKQIVRKSERSLEEAFFRIIGVQA